MRKPSESPGASHLVERQMLLSHVREKAAPRQVEAEPAASYRFITITRDVGALGDDVASGLAKHLDWHVFDREIVDHIAVHSHVRQDLVRELDERSQSLIHDTVARLLLMAEGISFGNEEYHEALLKTLALLAARGKAIIVGRGSAYALQGEPGLHLRVFASPEVRVRRLALRWQVTPEEARRRMEKIDIERRSFRQHHFRQSVEDLRFFDAVFDTDRMSVEQIVHAVLAMLTSPEHTRHAPEPSLQETVPRPTLTPHVPEPSNAAR
ncbi:MAG: cytidylate kinase-like family protein [Acidobacteriia bacterium]|nr:cytidylate kinase-like family protein [Terriglobia bacterium]